MRHAFTALRFAGRALTVLAWAFVVASVLTVQAHAAVDVVPGVWDGYSGTRIVEDDKATLEECRDAVAARGPGTYTCRTIVRIIVTKDAPAPEPEPEPQPEPQPEPEPEPEPGPDPDPQWTHCAGEGQWCEFEGTHEVRFGAENAWIVIVRTGGVECSIEEFGGEDPIWGVSKTCELGAAVEAEPEPQPEPEPEPEPEPQEPQQPQAWPQPPMAGMPLVNAPELVTLTQPWTSNRLFQQSPEEIDTTDDGVGSFRTSCKPSHMAFDDPLVYPGLANRGRSHHHVFFGNSAVRAETDLDNLRNVGGSTCSGGTINKSAYWVPTVIDTRTNTPVVPDSLGVYYKSGYGLRNEYRNQIAAFPPGLRLLAGQPMAASVPQDRRYSMFCVNSAGETNHSATFPNCPAGSELWMQLEFPECWDGKNLDSPDHKSHMAYAGDNGGRCPSTHPVPITTITFNVIYRIRSSDHIPSWRLSSDMNPDARGVSMHGDWINGWDPEFHAIWLSRCTKAPMDCHTDNLGDGRRLRQD